jgi:putative methyltransferase (TIGR04325 family)
MPSLPAALRAVGRRVRANPVVRAALAWRYERGFARPHGGAFRGVFASAAEAARSAPATRPVGYDHRAAADMYRERLDRVYPSDYPAMFWLGRLLQPGTRVFDFGGHVGIHYFAYERYLDYPADLRWTVCDVPAVVAAGTAVARERGRPNLTFTTRFADAEGADVLIASGSLQYVDTSLAELLAPLRRRPRHLIIHRTPLYGGPAFVTLQNIQTSYQPYFVFNRAAFIAAVCGCGYDLVDEWSNLEHFCHIPFHEERSVPAYTGLYFRET